MGSEVYHHLKVRGSRQSSLGLTLMFLPAPEK